MKSRNLWLNSSDANTKFFYQSTILHRRCNAILGLKNNEGKWLFDPSDIHDHTIDFIKNIFSLSQSIPDVTPLDYTHHLSISELDYQTLFILPTEEDIFLAVMRFEPFKAPEPDVTLSIRPS